MFTFTIYSCFPVSNVHETIDRKWKGLQPEDDEREMERLGEVWIIDDPDGFGLYLIKKM